MTSNKRRKKRCALKGSSKTEKCHLLEKASLAIFILIYRSGDLSTDRYINIQYSSLLAYSRFILGGDQSFQWAGGNSHN